MPFRVQYQRFSLALCALLCLATASNVTGRRLIADDWPMWRFDSARTAASTNSLPKQLQLLWSKTLSPRQQAWDDPLNLDLMNYDRIFEPIVIDGRLILSFNDRDKTVAFDASTGEELWTVFADAPVRMPPAGWNGRVFVCSDDGFLYCIDAADGEVLWKFDAAPDSQKAIGNRRLTSAWPARGGPVVRDGTVYFAASIWPFMGTFVYALDAETGQVQWVNDRTGAQYIKQPHSAPSFAGVAPQGALVATESLLLVPGGRSVPAAFTRADGELKYFQLNEGGKGTGGSFVAANDQHFFVHTRLKGTRAFELASGVKTAFMPNEPVLAGDLIYTAESENDTPFVRAYAADHSLVWQVEADGSGDLILAGETLVAAGQKTISLISLPHGDQAARVFRELAVEAPAERLIVADNKLFAVTLNGTIFAFGDGQASEPLKPSLASANPSLTAIATNDQAERVVNGLLAASDASGYALWYGNSDSDVLRALALRSPFEQLAVVDSDGEQVARLRHQLDRAGRYGRVTVHHASAGAFKAPKYVANMIFVSGVLALSADRQLLANLYDSVRPYGGVMQLLVEEKQQTLAERIRKFQFEQAEIEVTPHAVIVRRQGALPGSADWTHQYGDIANTLKSDDQRVKLPLGVLWFGGSSNMDVLPRHGHGPPEQVVGGRLFIQGMNRLSARDVYTGRVLWQRDFDDLGTFDVYYDDTYEDVPLDPKYNQVHIPGANGRGTNYVVTEDCVYIVEGNVCHALDPATGETLFDLQLPPGPSGQAESWAYIGVYQDVLIGGLGFAMYGPRNNLSFESDQGLSRSRAGFGSKSLDRAASVSLVGFDRHTGQQLWKADANHSFWHNGIVAGGGRIYCLDKNPEQIEAALRRRGKSRPEGYRIVAFDYRSGKLEWEIEENIFGTWLGYSEEHDLLLQAGAKASDRLATEVSRGMAVYSGADGSLRWQREGLDYAGPCILHNDLIITNANSYTDSAGAFYLLNGKQKMIKNPLTGELQPWKVTRAYGCNNIIASENMLTFRSGAAGFYDLLSDAGTGNLGGFKSGCTSNLVVANGVLNAPDYTRTCSCAYQNQTSLALVHMPDVELWSVDSSASAASSGRAIERMGINFGAPGDRRDAAGQLWLEYPVIAEPAPPVSVQFNAEANFFLQHASALKGIDRAWILASGAQDVTELRLRLKLEDDENLNAGLPIEQAADDAEEDEDGSVNLTSSDLELVEDGSKQTVGLRFNHLNLPRGAVIQHAYIQFACDETSNDPTSLLIAAEDTGNARPFRSSSHDLTSRSLTAGEIGWTPPPWSKAGAAGDAQRTPDLAPLVQSIVNRTDWEPGNSLAFLIQGAGKRVAVSATGAGKQAPRLIVESDGMLAANVPPPPTKHYDVRLYFAAPQHTEEGRRVFDVVVQGDSRLADVTVDPTAKQTASTVHLIENVAIGEELHVQFIPKQGSPVISGIEVIQRPSHPGQAD